MLGNKNQQNWSVTSDLRTVRKNAKETRNWQSTKIRTMYLMKDFTENYQRNAFTKVRVSYHEGYVVERETATG